MTAARLVAALGSHASGRVSRDELCVARAEEAAAAGVEAGGGGGGDGGGGGGDGGDGGDGDDGGDGGDGGGGGDAAELSAAEEGMPSCLAASGVVSGGDGQTPQHEDAEWYAPVRSVWGVFILLDGANVDPSRRNCAHAGDEGVDFPAGRAGATVRACQGPEQASRCLCECTPLSSSILRIQQNIRSDRAPTPRESAHGPVSASGMANLALRTDPRLRLTPTCD